MEGGGGGRSEYERPIHRYVRAGFCNMLHLILTIATWGREEGGGNVGRNNKILKESSTMALISHHKLYFLVLYH